MVFRPSLHRTLILVLVANSAFSSPSITGGSNYCVGARQVKNINAKQRAFNKGPCAPVILVPGFLGTALQVQIDCSVLLENHPEIFAACGWTTCNSSDIKSLLGMPRKEYRLWVGDLTDKFSIVQTQDQKCLAEFLKFEPGKQKNYTEPKGITITWVGNTPQTSFGSNCGVSAVENLLGGKFSFIRNCALNGFQRSIRMLQNMGYISGINFQVIPYDFRKTIEFSQAQQYIKNSIESLVKNTGKKVVFFGHSYGNLQILKVLQGMKLDEKKQKVQNFVSVGAPYLGASKSLLQIIGGDTSYIKHFLSMQIGFNYFSQEALALGSRSILHFLPRFNLVQFRQQKWLKDTILNPPSWLPQNDTDYPLGDLLKSYNEPILKVYNETFQSDKQSYQKLFSLLSDNKNTYFTKLIQEGFNCSDRLFTLERPDVNTTLIFSGGYPTEIQYSYDGIQCSRQFKTPCSTLVGGGDGTVPSISNIATALKWISQNNQGGVKLVNYGAEKKISNAHYQTIQAQCLNKGTSNCLHPCFHQDPNILAYLYNILINGQKVQEGRLVHQNCQNLKAKNRDTLL